VIEASRSSARALGLVGSRARATVPRSRPLRRDEKSPAFVSWIDSQAEIAPASGQNERAQPPRCRSGVVLLFSSLRRRGTDQQCDEGFSMRHIVELFRKSREIQHELRSAEDIAGSSSWTGRISDSWS